MSSNYIDAKETSFQDCSQSSLIKCKLRITLIFRTLSPVQEGKAKAFRKGQDSNKNFSDDLAQELSGSTIRFTDEDENSGEYLIIDKTFVVREESPKAMQTLSKQIDEYVKGFCILSDIEKVIPCFFVPSISDAPIIPTLFFHSFPPSCLIKERNDGIYDKIDKKKGYVCFFGFDKTKSIERLDTAVSPYGSNKPIDQLLLQLSVLICYYTYFYIDYQEQKGWSFFKKNLADKKEIVNYLKSKQPPVKISMLQKVAKNISDSLSFPIKFVEGVFDFFCNYDGHLKNRIYGRILDVLDITKPGDPQVAIEAIHEIMLASGKNAPIDMYSFFDKCKYWDYIDNKLLRETCRSWFVCSSDMGFMSGYGALLFSNKKDYIYCAKGTDFDSYGRDWLATNILQGLTGFSIQHVVAVKRAKEIDKQIGNNGSLWFVGHSLGGGLASAGTICTENREGITFNAAGLNVIGVKVNQLINNRSGIFRPSQSWNRVHPYRIQGEVLDTVQKTILKAMTLGTLERGYGKKSVEVNIDGKVSSCGAKHGINNFLLKEVMTKLQPFDNACGSQTTADNKVIKIEFNSKTTISECNLA